jgi:hypothetical protein
VRATSPRIRAPATQRGFEPRARSKLSQFGFGDNSNIKQPERTGARLLANPESSERWKREVFTEQLFFLFGRHKDIRRRATPTPKSFDALFVNIVNRHFVAPFAPFYLNAAIR